MRCLKTWRREEVGRGDKKKGGVLNFVTPLSPIHTMLMLHIHTLTHARTLPQRR